MFIQHGQFATSFNQDRAFHIFDESMRWRKQHNVYDVSTSTFPAEYFDRKIIYYKNYDKFNHPILHFVVRNLRKGHEDNEAIKRFITYNFETYIRENPGKHIVVLFDMSEAGIGNLDYDIVKFIIASMQTYYPGLLAYLLMFKMPFLLSAAWRLIRTWMSSEADRFIKFTDTKTITDYISLDQLSKRMGEQISEGEVYDQRDIERFNKIDEYTLMFIQHGQFATSFNQDRAFHIFDESMHWRKQHNVYDVSTSAFPAEYFDRKIIYYKNYDKFNHPILHFVVRNLRKGHEDNEALKRFITYNFETYIRENPGKHIVVLFDMSEAGIGNLDYDIVKFIIASMQTYYPGLLAYLLMFKMPFLLSAAWRLIRTWMSSEADRFIKFTDTKTITDYISLDQLSKRMGGTADESE
ncbi:unnamed protein product [Rotaria sp. Silwood1]|nr:unnamed protein product [Rotaria sp. Silwood1]